MSVCINVARASHPLGAFQAAVPNAVQVVHVTNVYNQSHRLDILLEYRGRSIVLAGRYVPPTSFLSSTRIVSKCL